MTRNALIEHKEIVVVCEENGHVSMNHSYDILGARMLWKPKEARILTNFIDQPV
jgi:hypothetical protein